MRSISVRRLLLVTGLAALGIIYGILWVRMITSRAQRTGTDFLGFYTAARIAQEDGYSQVYNPLLQQGIEQEQVGFKLVSGQVLLFNHLPYFLPVLTLIVNDDYVASFLRWTAILLAFLILDGYLLARLLPSKDFTRRELWLAAAGSILFFPSFTSLMNGQDTVFVLLGAILWAWGVFQEKDWVAGLGLGLVTIRPQLALILALPFVFKRVRLWWWFVAACLALGLMVFLLLGTEGVGSLVRFLLVSAGGAAYGLHPEDMPSVVGILHRFAPQLDGGTIQWISLGGYLAAMFGLCWYFWRSRRIAEVQIGVAVLVSILFVPYLHYHDLAVLLLSLFCMLRVLRAVEKAETVNLVLLPLVASFLLLIGFINFSIRYPLVYLLMFGIGYTLIFPHWIQRLKLDRPAGSPEI